MITNWWKTNLASGWCIWFDRIRNCLGRVATRGRAPLQRIQVTTYLSLRKKVALILSQEPYSTLTGGRCYRQPYLRGWHCQSQSLWLDRAAGPDQPTWCFLVSNRRVSILIAVQRKFWISFGIYKNIIFDYIKLSSLAIWELPFAVSIESLISNVWILAFFSIYFRNLSNNKTNLSLQIL